MVEETPDKFSITNILAANLPYERTYSSTKVKNAPRKSKELVISNLEDYCSGDRSEMLTVLEYMNFTEPLEIQLLVWNKPTTILTLMKMFWILL